MNESSELVLHIVPQQKQPVRFVCVTITSTCMARYEDAILSSTHGKIVVGVVKSQHPVAIFNIFPGKFVGGGVVTNLCLQKLPAKW